MGAIQNAVDQTIRMGGLLYTQSPKYKAKVAEKEAQAIAEANEQVLNKERADLAAKEKLLSEDMSSQISELEKDPSKVFSDKSQYTFKAMEEHVKEQTDVAKRAFDLTPNKETYEAYKNAQMQSAKMQKLSARYTATNDIFRKISNEMAQTKQANKQKQWDDIRARFKQLKKGGNR